MSYPAAETEMAEAEARRQNALSLLFLLLAGGAFLLRFCVSPEIMNSFVDYTLETGAFYEKFHFGTYAIFALLPVMLFTRPIYLAGDDIRKFRDVVRYCLLLLGIVALLVLMRRAGSSGFFIDTYLVAGAAGLIVLAMNPAMREKIAELMLWMNIFSALLGIFEAVTRTRVLPYAAAEEVFRPTGLTEHPLTLGLICAASISFVVLTRWRTWLKVAAILVLFVGTAAAGARFALLLAGLAVLALILIVPWTRLSPRHERQAKLAVLVLALIGGAALLAVLAAGGFLSRFSGGIVDENFYARTDIYKIFDYVTWREILLGADLNEILKIVNDKLNLPYIESTPVYLTFQLGAPMALAFGGLVLWLFWRLLRHMPRPAWIGTGVFLAAALSNNTLSSKTPVVTLFVVMILAFGGVVSAQRRDAAAP